MKLLLPLAALLALGACATDCSTITDPNFRDQCFAKEIQDARIEAERAEEEAAENAAETEE